MSRVGIAALGLYILFVAFGCKRKAQVISGIVPEPVKMEQLNDKTFRISAESRIVVGSEDLGQEAAHLNGIIRQELDVVSLESTKVQNGDIVLSLNPHLDSLTNEGYILHVKSNNLSIESATAAGVFYGIQSLRQLLPASLEKNSVDKLIVPAVRIVDKPRFKWRGMHLDVSRHFMPVDFIKKYVDYLAMHKLNVFHWHLVDGIGWRIEIKSHPELTDIGAWRVVKEGKKPWQDFEVWREGESRPKYGGFYSQEEIREIVEYAHERHITVVPEIELPGHSEVVFQCYPELICTDHKGEPLNNTGVYCANNPGSYQLLEDIIDEVIDLFPSEYIHIGGDEVNKSNWKACAKCRGLMRSNDYDEFELQSHFVNHFDKYLLSKGRKLMGWHEILEGELSKTASIMYWGGEGGVANNLEHGHPTVLTTGSHLYFDHYQSLSVHEPKAFGGYAPLKKVYDYEPVPEGVSPEIRKKVLGVQGNVWTEYMETPSHVEYMTMPRMAALAEIAWQKGGTKDWTSFRNKLKHLLIRYETMGINYSKSAFRPEIQFELERESRNLEVTLNTELESDIYYTIDGSTPDPKNSHLYEGPFTLSASAPVKAIAVKNGQVINEVESVDAVLHKARGADIAITPEPRGKYAADGPYTLVDTDFGGSKWGNGKWVGILSKDFVVDIKLPQQEVVSNVGVNCIEETSAGIYFPQSIEVMVSLDGAEYRSVQKWKSERKQPIVRSPEIQVKNFLLEFEEVKASHLKIKCNYQRVKGSGVFTFVDEVIVL